MTILSVGASWGLSIEAVANVPSMGFTRDVAVFVLELIPLLAR
jgi:hypothetical protein